MVTTGRKQRTLGAAVALVFLLSSLEMNAQDHEQMLDRSSSGTGVEPASTPAPMLMSTRAGWMFMFHANAFVVSQQQSGPRGEDKVFSTNWFMPMAQRQLGPGTLTLRTMLSLEPLTITDRRYPLLFQQGETAFGKPIVDGQHPHNVVMELAGLYDLPLGEKASIYFYAAPVGDPAIGPTAYAHRASASEDPLAPLGHHQQDSTHIASDVITLGLSDSVARLEFSGFHGREPDEHRWELNSGKMDSWSTRLSALPSPNWSAQYSYASISSPEATSPREDQARMTASISYNRALARGNWANTLLWGRTRFTRSDAKFNSYLFESTLRFRNQNYLWTRLESATRSSELLLATEPERPIGRVQAYSLGYDRDLPSTSHVSVALGTQLTAYTSPPLLREAYGDHPFGVVLFLRVRPVAPTMP